MDDEEDSNEPTYIQVYDDTIQGCFSVSDGAQIWYTDGKALYRIDSPPEMNQFNRRELRLIKALLDESLDTINSLLDSFVS